MSKKKKKMDTVNEVDLKDTKFGSIDLDGDSLKGVSVSFNPHEITAKIMEFGKILTGIPLYSYQETIAYRIIYSVITFEGSVLTVLLSRQSGKSETMAFVIDTLCTILPALAHILPDLDQFKQGFRIGLFAPQSDQVVTTYSRAMSRLDSASAVEVMSDPDLDLALESTAKLILSNGSFLTGQVASKQSKIESKTYDLVIVEEAQDVDDFLVQKSIEPMVSATGGTIIKVGTTGTTKNHFWNEINSNRKTDRRVKDERLYSHIEYDYKSIIQARREQYAKDGKKFHLNYEADILRKRSRWGEESQAFKLAYALIWDLESGMLISDKEFDNITNRKKGFNMPARYDKVIAGLDIGRSPASTILTIAKTWPDDEDPFKKPYKEILAWIDLGGLGYEEQHHALLDAIVEYGVTVLFADYSGVGKPVVDRLMHACGEYVFIMPYPFSTQSKSDLGYNLITEVQTRRIIVPANKIVRGTEEYIKFEEQMKNCQKYFNGPFLVYEKSPNGFDDYVDSLALMCMAGNEDDHDQEEMEVSANPLYGNIYDTMNMIKTNKY